MAHKQLTRTFLLMITFLSMGLTVGCSGTQDSGLEDPGDEQQMGDFGGTEDPLATEPEPDPEPESEPESFSGVGRLHVKVTAGGKAASGHIRILTAEVEPQVINEGSANQTFDVKAGRYDVEVRLEDTLDRPEKRLSDVHIKGGETAEREVDFMVGTITLQPRRGRAIVQSKVRWRYAGGGDWFEGTSQTGQELTLSCGRYDAEIKVGRTEIVINDIQVYEGKRSVSPPVSIAGGR